MKKIIGIISTTVIFLNLSGCALTKDSVHPTPTKSKRYVAAQPIVVQPAKTKV